MRSCAFLSASAPLLCTGWVLGGPHGAEGLKERGGRLSAHSKKHMSDLVKIAAFSFRALIGAHDF